MLTEDQGSDVFTISMTKTKSNWRRKIFKSRHSLVDGIEPKSLRLNWMNEWIWSYCVWRAVNSFWSNYSTKCLFKCISLIQFHLIRRRSTCTGSLYKHQWNASTLIHLSNPVKLNFEMEECSWQWFVQTKYEFVRFNYKRMSHHDPNRTSSLIVHTLSAERASFRNKIGLWKQKKNELCFPICVGTDNGWC